MEGERKRKRLGWETEARPHGESTKEQKSTLLIVAF